MKLNKSELLNEKCKQLIAEIIYNPNSLIELKNTIPIELFPKPFQAVFDEFYQLCNFDHIAAYHIIQKNGFSLIDFSDYNLPQNISLRIKEFYDIIDSINTEKILREALGEAKDSIKGLDLLSETSEKLKAELKKYSRFEKPKNFAEKVKECLEEIEEEIKGSKSLIKTERFPSFNNFTGGLSECNLICIAGAFKNGKTSFALNLMMDFIFQGLPSAIFSLEMTEKEVTEKILSMELNIPYELLRNPKKLSDSQRADLMRVTKKFSDKKLFILDNLLSFNEIEATIKKLKEAEGLKVVMIDYIGLIKSDFGKYKSIESREREISLLSNRLKLIAKETQTIIIALSQLNRSGFKEASSINLAESIGLARDSDFLFTIFNPFICGLEQIKIGFNEVSVKENYFVVKLDSSRHSQSGRSFILEMNECGKMFELDFNHSFANKITKSKANVENIIDYEIETPF